MKTILLIIIAVFLVLISGISSWTSMAEEMPNSIDGFAISDPQGNVKHYPITELDKMPCEDFMPLFQPEMMRSEQNHLIGEKVTSCVKDTGGYAVTYENTKNSNECWYQEDDGSMIPCVIDSTGPSMVIGMGLIIFWPYIVLGIVIVIIFIIWRKRK